MNNTKPFTKSQLAKALGVSKGLVSQHAKRGMPTHSFEAAKEWRDRNLAPLSRKEFRVGGNDGGKPRLAPAVLPPPPPVAPDIDEKDVVICAHVPNLYFQSILIAAAAADAGIRITGEQAIELTGCLFIAYMTVFGEEKSYRFDRHQIPYPGDPRRADLADEIDKWLCETDNLPSNFKGERS